MLGGSAVQQEPGLATNGKVCYIEPQALAEVQRNLAQQGVMSVGKGKTDA